MAGTSATRAKDKWNKQNYDSVLVRLKKGKKELYKDVFQKGGYNSLNDFIEKTLDEKVEEIERTLSCVSKKDE